MTETIKSAALRAGLAAQITLCKVSLICRACGTSLERVLRNLDELPSCPNCRSEMLIDNVRKET